MIQKTALFRQAHPEAKVGLVALTGVVNPPSHPRFEQRKRALEEELRRKYAGFDRKSLRSLAPIQAYEEYYRRWAKSYHVLAQVESLVLKGKPIPSVAVLVEAMFMAELKNMLLTAGHDLDRLVLPLRLDLAQEGQTFIGIREREEAVKAGDMLIADGEGIISSVLGGPDARTRIMPETVNALFVVYAPAGVLESAIRTHLADIESYVRIVAPEATTREFTIV